MPQLKIMNNMCLNGNELAHDYISLQAMKLL